MKALKFFDRKGQPLSIEQWKALQKDDSYLKVAEFKDERVRISTIWLGVDHAFGEGKPLIFETIIFPKDEPETEWRYSTEAEAREFHETLVDCYHNDKDPEEAYEQWKKKTASVHKRAITFEE